MYPPLNEIEEYLDNQPQKPFIMCEYSHAMGNGPGDLEDHFELIDKYDAFCGGFVWEWCDHAIHAGRAEDGRIIYQYGGDNGEVDFSGNFCMDGLVYPDRRPHTGLLEYKNVNRPARAVYDQSKGLLTLHNYKDFVDLKEYLVIGWEVSCDGEITASGQLDENVMVSIRPHEEGSFPLEIPVPDKGRCYLKLSYYLKEATEILPAGYLLGFDEILLENEDGRNQTALALAGGSAAEGVDSVPAGKADSVTAGDFGLSVAEKSGSALTVEESERYLTINGPAFTYVYDTFTGLFDRLEREGQELITRPMEINIWRAPVDNDNAARAEWIRARYHEILTRTFETEYVLLDKEVQIVTSLAVSAQYMQRILDVRLTWTVSESGKVTVDMDVRKDPEFPVLPRFGIRMFLPKEMDQVTYYGMGPQESYVDKHRASWHGKYTAEVTQLHEDYTRPQENGSHYDCDFVIVEGGDRRLAVTGGKAFCFNASVYTQEELWKKRHNYELEPCGFTVLCLDYAQNGIGSNSCGPQLLEKYRFDEENFRFGLVIDPGTVLKSAQELLDEMLDKYYNYQKYTFRRTICQLNIIISVV